MGGSHGNRETQTFGLSGPSWLSNVDWKNPCHRRSVASSLIQSVYVSVRDCQENRKGPDCLAPSWWEFFHFKLHSQLIDDDSSIFGAIYEFNRQGLTEEAPRYVIAFRGTMIKPFSLTQEDLKLDLRLVRKGLQETKRFKDAMQAIQNMVHEAGTASKIWLVGHSLGSAMAMLAGKTMAKEVIFLQNTFLFNPPFLSAPIETSFKTKKAKQAIRIVKSFVTAALTVAVKGHMRSEDDPFVALSEWVPCLFVNPKDLVCAEYIGYFEHRETMKNIGATEIGKIADRNSIRSLLKKNEASHLLPSAYLIKNNSPSLPKKKEKEKKQ